MLGAQQKAAPQRCLIRTGRRLCGLNRDSSSFVDDVILGVHVNELGVVFLELEFGVGCERGDDQEVAGLALRAAAPLMEMVPEPRWARIA